MKTRNLIFLFLVVMVIFSCSSTLVNNQGRVTGKYTGESILEASLAAVNWSLAELNLAVSEGRMSAEDAAKVIKAQTLAGQKNQSKRVDVDIDEDTHTDIDKNSSGSNGLTPAEQEEYSGFFPKKKKGNK